VKIALKQSSAAALFVLMLAVFASPVFAAQTGAFERVPAAALVALAEARGKPFSHGIVFVNGHYLAPPYVVSRYGTALAINGIQISGQLVPWSAFLATQGSGVARGGKSPEPGVRNLEPSVPSSAAATNVDDLFGDAASVPASSSTNVASAKNVEHPVPSTGPSSFVPNAKSDLLLKRINAMRTDLDRALRGDQFFFFSTKYARVNGNANTAFELLEVLPEAMRDAADAADLQARLRAVGVTYIGPEVCDDLIAHRVDYPARIERRRTMKAEAEALRVLQQDRSVL